MQNGIPLSDEMQLQLAERYGGIEAWGGQMMDPHYSAAWAWAGNTPFRWGKQVGSHLGGTRNPMVVHWPARITDTGALRSHFTHVIDVGPTILDIAGIPAPSHVDGIEQEPLHGVTFADSLADAAAPERHTQQYFETMGNRAMYKDGWWLAMKTPRIPWVLTPDALRPYAPGVWDPDAARRAVLPARRLHPGEDLAADHPEKVAELRELFWAEAEKYKVLPLLATCLPSSVSFRRSGCGHGGVPGRCPEHHVGDDPADLQPLLCDQRGSGHPGGGAEGVIVAEADHLGGFSLFVGRQAHPHLLDDGRVHLPAAGRRTAAAGEVNVRMEFAADAAKPATGGEVTLYINDRPVGKGRMDHTVPIRFSAYAGMDIGRDNGGSST